MMEKVAIIMPCRNSIRCIEAAIRSIIYNTNYPFKLIILDGESTDGTKELINEYARNYEDIEVHHIPSKGLVNAFNLGIKYAGDMDVYLTHDDVILPKLYGRDWLTELVRAKNNPDCGLVTTLAAGGVSGPTYIDGLHWVGTWSMYIPRTIINKVGLLDENLGPGDDIDYCYRIYKEGFKIYVSNFWVDHHRKSVPNGVHKHDESAIQDGMGVVFRKKWKLGEFA